MKLKIFVWIILRVFSCFADLLLVLAFVINKKRNRWVLAVLDIMWNFLVYIVFWLMHFRHPLIWTVFASSWSWGAGFILSDATTKQEKEIV